MNSFSEKLPKWDQLLSYDKDNVFTVSKISLLSIPALASVAEVLHSRLGFTVSIPVSLFVSYVAALSYFSASILVRVNCPKNIRNWTSLERFLCEHSPKLRTHIEARAISNASDIDDEYAKLFFESLQDDGDVDKELMESWSRNNESLVFRRLICAGLFLISAGAILYLALYDAPGRVIQNTFFSR